MAAAERGSAQLPLGRPGPFELSATVRLQTADVAVRGQLERIESDREQQRWNHLLTTLRQLMDRHGDVVVPVEPDLYIPLRSYAQAEIAGLPAEVRADYRDAVEVRAKQWYADGVARHDRAPLEQLVDRLFCSRWGDDALMALGEMALERGWYATARDDWRRLSRVAAAGLDGPSAELSEVRGAEVASAPSAAAAASHDCWWIYYPDTDYSLAEIRARLVLVSIRERDLPRAGRELRRFRQLHPQAQGWLAGRQAKFADSLAEELAAAAHWPPALPADDWPTLAGSQRRTSRHPLLGQLVSRAWQVPIGMRSKPAGERFFSTETVPSALSISKGEGALLDYHPVIVGDLVLLCDQTRILGFDLRTGRPAWGTPDGVLFAGPAPPRLATPRRRVKIGRPHYTLTAHNNLLLARMGDPTTSWAVDSGQHQRAGYLVCLDLSADGRLVWEIRPDGPRWSFEGSPLADDANVYAAMRRSDVRPEVHVACFDAATGRRRWRRFICAADTPAQGQVDEVTSNLLTLAEGTIYCNTNLGAVAALAPRDGTVRWIRRYQRVTHGDLAAPAANFRRQLNPCVYDHGRVFVAASDCQPIFAVQASTGRIAWRNPLPDDVTELLGVGAGNLIASGQRLWWLDAETGAAVWRWPEGKRSGLEPRGRGALIGASVYWPCADAIRVLPCRPAAVTRETEEPIRLDRFGIEPGNLVATAGHLLVAGPRRLAALTDQRQPPAKEPRNDKTPELAKWEPRTTRDRSRVNPTFRTSRVGNFLFSTSASNWFRKDRKY